MLESTLHDLVEAIKNQTFKSKQACFDYYLDDLLIVKKYYSWQAIADFINLKTEDSLSLDTYKFMLKRAKGKRKLFSDEKTRINSTEKAAKNSQKLAVNRQNDTEPKVIVRTPYDLKQLRNKPINLDELEKSGDDE